MSKLSVSANSAKLALIREGVKRCFIARPQIVPLNQMLMVLVVAGKTQFLLQPTIYCFSAQIQNMTFLAASEKPHIFC